MVPFRGLNLSQRTLRQASVSGVTALALTLGACGGSADGDSIASPTPSSLATSASPTPTATATVEPTMLADLTELGVTDDLATQPEVDAPYPFAVEQTLDQVIVEGSGVAVPHENALVKVQYVGINARTGGVFDSSWAAGEPVVFPLAQVIPGFATGLVGKPVGSRVAIAIPSEEGYGAQGNPQAGIEPDDTLLFVIDVIDTELTGPQGQQQTAPAGLPQVTEGEQAPRITIPADLPEPAEVQVATLVQGDGAALAPQDALTSHSVCVTWDGTEIHNDYGAASATDAAAGSAHQALFNSLVGQQVGSRVLVALPGSVAYPNGNPSPSIAPNTAMACVVDILFVYSY